MKTSLTRPAALLLPMLLLAACGGRGADHYADHMQPGDDALSCAQIETQIAAVRADRQILKDKEDESWRMVDWVLPWRYWGSDLSAAEEERMHELKHRHRALKHLADEKDCDL